MPIKTILFFAFLLAAAAAWAAPLGTHALAADSYDDIFISATNADITVAPIAAGGVGAFEWRTKYCTLVAEPAQERVMRVEIRPKRQHAYLKRLVGIKLPPCKVTFNAGEDKNIYISSESGSIKLSDLPLKRAKIYTALGDINIDNYRGHLTAETLRGRINARNIDAPATDLKSASGHISASGNMGNLNVLNTSGRTRINGRAQVLRFYSSEGDLTAAWTALPDNPLEISARSFAGDIDITLPRQTDLEEGKNNIYLKSFYGRSNIKTQPN